MSEQILRMSHQAGKSSHPPSPDGSILSTTVVVKDDSTEATRDLTDARFIKPDSNDSAIEDQAASDSNHRNDVTLLQINEFNQRLHTKLRLSRFHFNGLIFFNRLGIASMLVVLVFFWGGGNTDVVHVVVCCLGPVHVHGSRKTS